MHLLAINLYEIGQFLRILLWVFLPIFVIVLLITTYIHHRRKSADVELVLEPGNVLLAVETSPDSQPPGEDNLYKGLLWVKEKFEAYREQANEKVMDLKGLLDQRTAAVESLKQELALANEKIADLKTKLESNMSLLMNIHKELDKSLEKPSIATSEASVGDPIEAQLPHSGNDGPLLGT